MKTEKNGLHVGHKPQAAKSQDAKSQDAKSHDGKAQDGKAPKTELDRLLESVDHASKRLNGAASEATKRIDAVEERLLDAEPGISVWGEPLRKQQASFTRADGTLGIGERVITLGFDKVKKDKWGLAVREQVMAENSIVEEDVLLLRKADRGLRLLALPHLEALVRQILTVLEAQVRAAQLSDAGESSREPDATEASSEAEPRATAE